MEQSITVCLRCKIGSSNNWDRLLHRPVSRKLLWTSSNSETDSHHFKSMACSCQELEMSSLFLSWGRDHPMVQPWWRLRWSHHRNWRTARHSYALMTIKNTMRSWLRRVILPIWTNFKAASSNSNSRTSCIEEGRKIFYDNSSSKRHLVIIIIFMAQRWQIRRPRCTRLSRRCSASHKNN